MTFIKKIGNGDYYIHRAKGSAMGRKTDITKMSNTFLIKAKGSSSGNSYCGGVTLGSLILPQEFVGKRLRFKVEVEDDDWTNYFNKWRS